FSYRSKDRMKAEHRHQLHTNVLADRMGRLVKGMKSAPRSTSTLIWIFLVLALATFALWQYAASATMKDRSELWTHVDKITHDPSLWTRIEPVSRQPLGLLKLQEVEVRNPGTIPARTSEFEVARWNLRQGLEALAGGDRLGAAMQLDEARRLYTKL